MLHKRLIAISERDWPQIKPLLSALEEALASRGDASRLNSTRLPLFQAAEEMAQGTLRIPLDEWEDLCAKAEEDKPLRHLLGQMFWPKNKGREIADGLSRLALNDLAAARRIIGFINIHASDGCVIIVLTAEPTE